MSLKTNLIYNVTLQVLNVLFPVITVPYISRVLGLENVGLVSFVTTYVSYFVLFAALGINTYGVREIAKYKDDQNKVSKIFSELFVINIGSTLVVTVIFVVTLFTIPMLEKERILFILAGISIYLVPTSIDWYFQGLENFRIITLRSLIIKIVSIVFLFIFVRQREDVIAYILLNAFSVIGANGWNIFYAIKRGLTIEWKHLQTKRHFKSISILFVSSVSISMYVILDTLMLGFLSDYSQVGIYSSATKLSKMILPALGAIGVVIFSRATYNEEKLRTSDNQSLLQKSFDLMIFLSLPVSVGLFFIAQRFVPLFFGQEFYGTITPMQIMSVLTILIGLSNFFGFQILLSHGKDSLFLYAVLCGTVSNIFTNLILIPRYGAIGASIASVFAETLVTAATIYYVYRRTTIRINFKVLLHSMMAVVSIILLFLPMNQWINNSIYFLTFFPLLGIITYMGIQYLLFKNYLMVQVFNKIKSFVR